MQKPCAGWDHRTVEQDDSHWAPMSTCWRVSEAAVEFHVHRSTVAEIVYRRFEWKEVKK